MGGGWAGAEVPWRMFCRVRRRLHDDQELWRRVVEEDPFFRFPVPLALYQAEDQAVYYLVGKVYA